MADKSRLTLDLEPELHRRLKIEAARKRTSMRDICVQALRRHLARQSRPIALDPDEVLTELWDNEDDAVYDDL